MDKPKLLVVEDDPGLVKQLRWSLDAYEVVTASDRSGALSQVRRHLPPVVTLDLGLPPDTDGATEGLATLQQILAMAPDTQVVVMSGNQDRANALKAVALGAYDFHRKPVVPEILALVLERALVLHAMRAENRKLRQLDADSPLAGIVSRDPGMLRLCRKVEKVAPSSATVMLLGGSGSGKELLARALHDLGGRKQHRFIAINCASIPDSLLESELFGHEKGAFTGAAERTLGKIELANGGTFFLDEIGDMPLPLQAKLLRFLQERVIERVGGRTEIPVEVRVVCATHQDLEVLVREGRFRGDLYYRLSEVVLQIPPLAERQGDSVLLAHHFRERACKVERRGNLQFSEAALAAIEHHPWPGNVRELENCVRRAVILCEGAQIAPADLGLPSSEVAAGPVNLRQVRDEVEYKVMVQALARANGNIVKAAELLGVSRPTLYDMMHHHGVKP